MLRVAVLLILSLILSSCDSSKSTTTTAGSLRWMDRTIYLANADASDVNRNNFFQKAKVKEALSELQDMSSLGEGYFKFVEVDESTLNTSLDTGSVSEEQKSFILIWPDAVFNNYLATVVNGQTPDPNAIAVLNDSNKRKFFIIIRASCISSSSTGSSSCSNLGLPGFKALVARQMGFLVGMATKDCGLFPSEVMCAFNPSDSQFSDNSKLRFSAGFNNALESITLNPNFYSQ